MVNWYRLVASFDANAELDVNALHAQLSQGYDVGYTGLYSCGTEKLVYVESKGMDKAVVLVQLSVFGLKKLPKAFQKIRGVLEGEVGVCRTPRCKPNWKTRSALAPREEVLEEVQNLTKYISDERKSVEKHLRNVRCDNPVLLEIEQSVSKRQAKRKIEAWQKRIEHLRRRLG